MADQFAYPNMHQTGQAGGYPFHYPTGNGDQGAQLLQGYALPQQGGAGPVPGSMFGGQSAGSYNFDQASGYSQSSSVPVCQVDGVTQVPLQHGGGGFGYPNLSGSFNQYGGMGQSMPPGFGGDMQHFNPLMANAFGQTMPTNGAILEAIAHEQGLAGFNSVAFLQDSTGGQNRGGIGGRGHGQRGGFNKFNADGLREDTVFVSNLPQNIDHDVLKSQFGVVGKIKMNTKTGMPMVWIFKEKGIPKGEALVTYEDPSCVQAAIQWFKEHEFMNRKIDVKQATNSQRPVIIPPGGGSGSVLGGNNSNGSTNPATALAVAAVAAAASGNTMASLMNNSSAAANLAALGAGGHHQHHQALMGQFDSKDYSNMGRGVGHMNRGNRGGGGFMNGRGGGGVGSTQAGSREGDWSCTQCGNINFSWREQCNRCEAIRSQEAIENMDMPIGPRGGGMYPSGRGGGMQGSVGVMNSAPPVNMPGFGRGMSVNPGMGGGNRGGRGGGPMRGSGVGVGRARPAPY